MSLDPNNEVVFIKTVQDVFFIKSMFEPMAHAVDEELFAIEIASYRTHISKKNHQKGPFIVH